MTMSEMCPSSLTNLQNAKSCGPCEEANSKNTASYASER